MLPRSPDPITPAELRRRRCRVLQLARAVEFVGRVEYRHVYSQTGGAQYGRGVDEQGDLLVVYAEAFERDADPEDFSLRAMVAHERGHQLIARHPRLSVRMSGVTPPAEEVLASLVGAIVLGPGPDSDPLAAKAVADVLAGGTSAGHAVEIVQNLWDQLGELL